MSYDTVKPPSNGWLGVCLPVRTTHPARPPHPAAKPLRPNVAFRSISRMQSGRNSGSLQEGRSKPCPGRKPTQRQAWPAGDQLWFNSRIFAGDKSGVAGVELATASEPPARQPRIWGPSPFGRRPPPPLSCDLRLNHASLRSAPATQASCPSWDTTNHGGVQREVSFSVTIGTPAPTPLLEPEAPGTVPGAMLTRRVSMENNGVTLFARHPRPACVTRHSMLERTRAWYLGACHRQPGPIVKAGISKESVSRKLRNGTDMSSNTRHTLRNCDTAAVRTRAVSRARADSSLIT